MRRHSSRYITYSFCAGAVLSAMLAACSSDMPAATGSVGPRPSPDAAGAEVTPSVGLPAKLSNRFAYVWADQPSTATCTPNASYAYNATGGPIQVVRGGTGTYIVSFGSPNGWGSAPLGFAATTHGSSTVECQMRNNMMSGTWLSVYVFCNDRVT